MEGSGNDAVKATGLSGLIEVREEQVRSHLSEVVRETVEETLDAMLEADADRLPSPCGIPTARRCSRPRQPGAEAADEHR